MAVDIAFFSSGVWLCISIVIIRDRRRKQKDYHSIMLAATAAIYSIVLALDGITSQGRHLTQLCVVFVLIMIGFAIKEKISKRFENID
jgi:hypothetical protein